MKTNKVETANPRELLDIHSVKKMTGIGKTNIDKKLKLREFPQCIRIGRRSLWIQSEVQQWIQDKIVVNRI